jgi:hypothetical protein
MSEVPHAASTEARARQAATLPQILDAGFEAFEFIRITARSYQDQVPELFATLMTAADAAVDGREALTIAPSLPRRADPMPESAASADVDGGQAADVLAELAAVLHDVSPRPPGGATWPMTRPPATTRSARRDGSAS